MNVSLSIDRALCFSVPTVASERSTHVWMDTKYDAADPGSLPAQVGPFTGGLRFGRAKSRSAAMTKLPAYYVDAARALLERARAFEKEFGTKPLQDGGFVRREVLRDFIERHLNVTLTEPMADALERVVRQPRDAVVETVALELEKILKSKREAGPATG
jgi:hypothetical protein